MNWKRLTSIIAALALCVCLSGTAMAVNTHATFIVGAPDVGPRYDSDTFVISNQLDFSGLTTYATGGVSTQDVVQLLRIPAGTYVLQVGVRTVTATTTGGVTGVATVGDATDVDGWLTSFDIGTTSSGVSTSAEEGIAGVYHTTYGGKYYSTADYITMTIPNFSTHDFIANDPVSMCTNWVIQPWAICIKPSTQKAYGKVR